MKLKNIIWITLVIILLITIFYVINVLNLSLEGEKLNEGFDQNLILSSATAIWNLINMTDTRNNLINQNSIEFKHSELYRSGQITQLKNLIAFILNNPNAFYVLDYT